MEAAPRGAASIAYAAQKATTSPDSVVRALDATPASRTSPANAIFCPAGVTDGGCALAVNPKGDGAGVSAVGVGG